MQVLHRLNSPSGIAMARALADVQSDKVICWGVQGEGLNGGPTITGCAQLEKFEAADIARPVFTNELDIATSLVRDDRFEMWGRDNDHTRGRDIVGFRHRDWCTKDYWVKFEPSVAEWRIHVFKGRCIARGLKHQVDPPRRRLWVRSRNNGWYLRHDIDPPETIRPFAISMVKALNYDFGACDILVKDDGSYVALECNKMPGLDEYTLNQYVNAIKSWLERQARREQRAR